MGIALIPVALLASGLILAPAVVQLRRVRWIPAAAAGVLLLAIGTGVVIGQSNTALSAVAKRFSATQDFRTELWRDGSFATEQSWPMGRGLGGAQPALIAAERLEVLDESMPNRVHNDYLELALEGGIVALGLLLAAATILFLAAWRAWRERAQDRSQTGFGIAVLVIVALHSLVDYPLRSMALACLAGMGAGLLFAPPRNIRAAAPEEGQAAS
jgi:exopolysaccharide production protein ExoQ